MAEAKFPTEYDNIMSEVATATNCEDVPWFMVKDGITHARGLKNEWEFCIKDGRRIHKADPQWDDLIAETKDTIRWNHRADEMNPNVLESYVAMRPICEPAAKALFKIHDSFDEGWFCIIDDIVYCIMRRSHRYAITEKGFVYDKNSIIGAYKSTYSKLAIQTNDLIHVLIPNESSPYHPVADNVESLGPQFVEALNILGHLENVEACMPAIGGYIKDALQFPKTMNPESALIRKIVNGLLAAYH